jgi:phosphoglycerate dehydrogenase-like enzyme
MKIVLTRGMSDGDIEYIKNGLDLAVKGQYEIIVPSEYSEDGICSVCDDADILLGPFVTKKIIGTAKKLKLIQVPWTGMDTFDFTVAQDCTIPICNTHSNADSVAEMTLAIILDLLKKLSFHDRKMRTGSWNRDQEPLDLKSKMLGQQTVCIIGYGNIGARVAKLTKAFGAKIIAAGGHTDDEIVSEAYGRNDIKKAIARADVVVCTIPLTNETRGLINADLISTLKDGAILVNVSRGAVLDEDAVWNALESGKLGAFGSDVWWNAPKRGESQSYPSSKHEFWKKENVLLSPHRAGFVEDSLPHLDGAIANIIALIKGEALSGIVDVKKGY